MDKIENAKRLAKLISINTVTEKMANNPKINERFVLKLQELFPNLFAKASFEMINGALLFIVKGKSENNPIMFMNHYDVVEATNFSVDPFKGIISDDKLYGRGTLDTKGGLYCMLEAIEELLSTDFIPNQDIYFLSTNNEETSGSSADYISNMFKEKGINFDFILDEGGYILDDPLGVSKGYFAMVGIGEKDVSSIKFIAKDNAGHASFPNTNQPFVRLSKFINKVGKPNFFKVSIHDSFLYTFAQMSINATGLIKFILSHPYFFKPLLTLLLPLISNKARALFSTTIAFTSAKGSDADNVMPSDAYITGNIRFSHHEDYEKAMKKIIKVANKYDITLENADKHFKSTISPFTNIGFNNIKEAMKGEYKDVKVVPYIQSSASDSKYFSRVSNNVYRFIPIIINDQQLSSIHGADENVSIEYLPKAINVYKELMKGEFHA